MISSTMFFLPKIEEAHIPSSLVNVYPLVNIQKAMENGHRNSEFSHEHGDFPSFFVRLPESTCSFHVPCMFQTVPEFVTFQDPGNLEALVAWRKVCCTIRLARPGASRMLESVT